MPGYFQITVTDNEGRPTRPPVRVQTEKGVALACDDRCDPRHVSHMAEMARQNPGYPYVISAWQGPAEARFMVWSCDLIYSEV